MIVQRTHCVMPKAAAYAIGHEDAMRKKLALNYRQPDWTPERIERLRELAPDHTPSRIARVLGSTTPMVRRIARLHNIKLLSQRVAVLLVLALLLSGCAVTHRFAFESPLFVPVSPLPQPQLELTLTAGDGVILATVNAVGPNAPGWARVNLLYPSQYMAFDRCIPVSAVCTQLPPSVIQMSGALPISAWLFVNANVSVATLRIVSLDDLLVANDGAATVRIAGNS